METTYNSVVKKLSHQNKNRIVVPGFFDFQDLCESEIYEIAKKHSLRPKKLEDLSDGTSFVGKIYSGRELFGLQFQELFSLTSERGTYSSSVFFVRKYDQEISYQKKKYRVTWAVGIMISVVTEHNKIEAFSDFYESAIFLKQGKYKNKFKIQSIGVVGRGIDSEISRLNKIIYKPNMINEAVSNVVSKWYHKSTKITPQIIGVKKIS